MKEVILNNGMSVLVDDDDFDRVNKYKWCAIKSINTYYARASKKIDGKRPFMHNFIFGIQQGMFCDHVNHNGLDNRKENLRAVTTRQNAQNLFRKTASIYPGVSYLKGKWISRIRVGTKRLYLGYFNTELEAFEAYCNALKKIGEVCLV